jgi:hypothetical protein
LQSASILSCSGTTPGALWRYTLASHDIALVGVGLRVCHVTGKLHSPDSSRIIWGWGLANLLTSSETCQMSSSTSRL